MAEYEADKIDVELTKSGLVFSITKGKTVYKVTKPAKQVKALIGNLKRKSKLAQKKGWF